MSDLDNDTRRRYAGDPRHNINHPVRTRSRATPWIAALLVVALLAVGAFFLFGGDADVDTDGGNIEAPSIDAEVDAPDVDVETPDVSVDPGSADVDRGDADADAGS